MHRFTLHAGQRGQLYLTNGEIIQHVGELTVTQRRVFGAADVMWIEHLERKLEQQTDLIVWPGVGLLDRNDPLILHMLEHRASTYMRVNAFGQMFLLSVPESEFAQYAPQAVIQDSDQKAG